MISRLEGKYIDLDSGGLSFILSGYTLASLGALILHTYSREHIPSLPGSDLEAIRSGTEALVTASQAFAQRLYEQAAAGAESGASPSGSSNQEAADAEVVDAEIVDEPGADEA